MVCLFSNLGGLLFIVDLLVLIVLVAFWFVRCFVRFVLYVGSCCLIVLLVVLCFGLMALGCLVGCFGLVLLLLVDLLIVFIGCVSVLFVGLLILVAGYLL